MAYEFEHIVIDFESVEKMLVLQKLKQYGGASIGKTATRDTQEE